MPLETCLSLIPCTPSPSPWPTGLRADEVQAIGTQVGGLIAVLLLMFLVSAALLLSVVLERLMGGR